jgi:hypothetical protein
MRSDQEVMLREVIRRLELLGRESARVRDLLGLVGQWLRYPGDPVRVGVGCDELTRIRVTLTGSCGVGFEGVTVSATLGDFTTSTTTLTGGGYYELDVTDGGAGEYTIEVVGTRVNTVSDTIEIECGDIGTITIGYTIKSEYPVCFCGFPLKDELVVDIVVDGANALNPGTYSGTMSWNSGSNWYAGCVIVPVNLVEVCDGSGNTSIGTPGWQLAGDDNEGETHNVAFNIVMSNTFCTLLWGAEGCTASGGAIASIYPEADSSCPAAASGGWAQSVSWLGLAIPIDLNFKVNPPTSQLYIEASYQVGYNSDDGYFIYQNHDERTAFITEAP